MMQTLILNYMRLHEHTHVIHVHERYLCKYTYEHMRTKTVNECAVTSERIVFS